MLKIELLRSAVKRYSHLEAQSAKERDSKKKSQRNSSQSRQRDSGDKRPHKWQNKILQSLESAKRCCNKFQWLSDIYDKFKKSTMITPFHWLAISLLQAMVAVLRWTAIWLIRLVIAFLHFLCSIFGIRYSGYFPENSKSAPIEPEFTSDDANNEYISYENFSKVFAKP